MEDTGAWVIADLNEDEDEVEEVKKPCPKKEKKHTPTSRVRHTSRPHTHTKSLDSTPQRLRNPAQLPLPTGTRTQTALTSDSWLMLLYLWPHVLILCLIMYVLLTGDRRGLGKHA